MTRAALILLTLAAGPALAETASLPTGCTARMTVQSANCTVRVVYVCKGDTAGHVRVDTYGAGGLEQAARFDPDFQMLERTAPESGITSRLVEITDALHLATVLTEGTDTYAYREEALRGNDAPRSHRVTGRMDRAGDPVVIDGQALLLLTGLRVVTLNTQETIVFVEEAYYDESATMVFGGRSFVLGDTAPVLNRTPVDFIFPGEDGYLSVAPLHGCAP